MAAADMTKQSLKDYGRSSPSLSPDPMTKAKVVQACDECQHMQNKCDWNHIQSSPSPILITDAPSAEPAVLATPQAWQTVAPASAPVNALEVEVEVEVEVGSIPLPMSHGQISSTPGALKDIFGLQSPIPSQATQVSRLALNPYSSAPIALETASFTTGGESASVACAPVNSDNNSHPSLTVTLRVNAANVPAHLKAMPSQGNPNGSASAPAPAPTAAVSRAPSAAPTPSAMPAEAAEHGAATRVYMNTKVTYHLLVGMKELAKHKPENPLRVLGEFLLARSAQYETGPTATTPTITGAPAPTAGGDDNAMDDEQ